jgi:hypothetical protein
VKGLRGRASPSIPSPTRAAQGNARIGAATIDTWVIAADEKRMIARQTRAALAAGDG